MIKRTIIIRTIAPRMSTAIRYFGELIRIRNLDGRNLEQLDAHSLSELDRRGRCRCYTAVIRKI